MSEIATGAATSVELAAEKAYLLGHKRRSRARSRSTRAPPSSSPRRWPAPAWPARSRQADSTSPRRRSPRSRPAQIDFTINQNPYLQGFLPTLYLYLYNLSGGLVPPPDTDTGLSFVTKTNVDPYLASPSRFEGSTTAQKVIPLPSGADQEPDRHHQHLTRAPGRGHRARRRRRAVGYLG